jgi:hypothetical protein
MLSGADMLAFEVAQMLRRRDGKHYSRIRVYYS